MSSIKAPSKPQIVEEVADVTQPIVTLVFTNCNMRLTPRIMTNAHLDATGLLCPLPVLKARKRLKELAIGDRLEVLADDPAAIVDIPHFCTEAGHKLVETSENREIQRYVIEKRS